MKLRITIASDLTFDGLKRLQWRLKTPSKTVLENSPVRTVHFRAHKIRKIDNIVTMINIAKTGNYCI